MKSEILSKARHDLKGYLKNKKITDIIVFGSAIKGKTMPRDIDIAVIAEEKIEINVPGFHTSNITAKDFFVNPPSIVNTILREGYSLRNDKNLSEVLNFNSRLLFSYYLEGLSSSQKVRAVNFLRGKNKEKGIIEENGGEWLANQVFILPIEAGYVIEQFLINSRIKFKKSYVLMH